MAGLLVTAPTGYSPVMLKHGPYSPSRLIVARCPARFQGRYILKDQSVSDSVNAARGSAIHEIFEKMDKVRVTGQPVTLAMTQSWLAEALGKYPAAYHQVDLVRRATNAYAANPGKYMSTTTQCEVEVSFARYEEESFLDEYVPSRAFVHTPVKGPTTYMTFKLDQLTVDHQIQVVTVLDHKSTPNASKNAEHVFQLGCYAWAASKLYPGYAVRTVIHYAHPDLNFNGPPDYWSAEDLQEVEDDVHARITAIESFQEYPALPGTTCDYCHMTQVCPAFKRLWEQNAKGAINLNANSVDDLVEIAKQLRVAGVVYDKLNEVLKDGIEKMCPTNGISIEGMWYGFKPGTEKVDWESTEIKVREESSRATQILADPNLPAEQRPALEKIAGYKTLDGVLEQHGVDPRRFQDWKGEKLKALYKTNKPELIEALKQFTVLERETRWGGHKN